MSSLNQYQDGQCTCDNIEARSCNPCSSGKTTITYSVCVCSLRYPAYNTHAPYCYLWLVRLCLIFPHYLINGTIFGKKSLNVVCVFWFSLLRSYETFLILRRIERDMIRNFYLHVECPLFSTRFTENLNFLDRFSKSIRVSNFMKIRPVGAVMFHADARTDG